MNDTPPPITPAEPEQPDLTDWRRCFWLERRAKLTLGAIGLTVALVGLLWRIIEATEEASHDD